MIPGQLVAFPEKSERIPKEPELSSWDHPEKKGEVVLCSKGLHDVSQDSEGYVHIFKLDLSQAVPENVRSGFRPALWTPRALFSGADYFPRVRRNRAPKRARGSWDSYKATSNSSHRAPASTPRGTHALRSDFEVAIFNIEEGLAWQ